MLKFLYTAAVGDEMGGVEDKRRNSEAWGNIENDK